MTIIKIRHNPSNSMQGLSQNPPVRAGLLLLGVACLHDPFSISQRDHVNCLPCMQRRSYKSTGRVDIRSVDGTRPIELGPKFALENCFSPQTGVSHYSVSLLSRFLSSPNSAVMSHLST